MPNWTEFEGINLLENETEKVVAKVLLKNELGGVSDGYQIDHAETSNSGFSFGGNQMDLSVGNKGYNDLFKEIVTSQVGQNFYDSIASKITQKGNSNILTQQEKNQIDSSLSSNYGKQLINQAFVDDLDSRSQRVDNLASVLNTTFTSDVKIALVDYDNQYGIDINSKASGAMRTKLQNIINQNGIITLEDVENSVRSTEYYQELFRDNKKGNSQETRIQETRKIIKDAGLVSDGSDSTTSLKNSLTTTLSTITVTAQKEAVAKSWFETFSDSLGLWTGSVTNFIKEVANDVVNFFSSPSESLSKIGGWISSAFTFGESEKTPDPSIINNSNLNLEINTNLTSGFAGNNDLTQTGNVIGDADWRATMPINIINGDGYKNVASSGIVSDGFRPGNSELSSYSNFNTQLNVDFSRLDNLTNQLKQANQSQSIPDISKLNLQLQNPLAQITNNAIKSKLIIFFTLLMCIATDSYAEGCKSDFSLYTGCKGEEGYIYIPKAYKQKSNSPVCGKKYQIFKGNELPKVGSVILTTIGGLNFYQNLDEIDNRYKRCDLDTKSFGRKDLFGRN
jgi:hypothetical protein